MIRPVSTGSTIHLLSWYSHRSCRHAKSTPTSEPSAASEQVDEIVPMKMLYCDILGTNILLTLLRILMIYIMLYHPG